MINDPALQHVDISKLIKRSAKEDKMKSVLISIRPEWCEMIASGKKTIEVRKTRPKLETPFKCYIYCTKPKMITKYVFKPEDYPEYMRPKKTVFCKAPDASSPFCSEANGNGKVIGEFACDKIDVLFNTDRNPANYMTKVLPSILKNSALSYDEFARYVGSRAPKNNIFGWHISDLIIYDKPKEVGEFHHCGENYHFDPVVIKPPQSWCYVEDMQK